METLHIRKKQVCHAHAVEYEQVGAITAVSGRVIVKVWSIEMFSLW